MATSREDVVKLYYTLKVLFEKISMINRIMKTLSLRYILSPTLIKGTLFAVTSGPLFTALWIWMNCRIANNGGGYYPPKPTYKQIIVHLISIPTAYHIWLYLNKSFVNEFVSRWFAKCKDKSFEYWQKATESNDTINEKYYNLSRDSYWFNTERDVFTLQDINWICDNLQRSSTMHPLVLQILAKRIIVQTAIDAKTGKSYQWNRAWIIKAIPKDILTALVVAELIDLNARCLPKIKTTRQTMEIMKKVLEEDDIYSGPAWWTNNGGNHKCAVAHFWGAQPIALCAVLEGNHKLLKLVVSLGVDIDLILPDFSTSGGGTIQRTACSVRHAIEVMARIHGTDSKMVINLKNACMQIP